MDTKGHAVGIIGALVAVFVLGFVMGERGEIQATLLTSGPEEVPAQVEFDPVWKAWRILEDKFVPSTTTQAVTGQDKVWGMISGLAQSYDDPYTTFMPPEEAKNFEEEISGEFGGVGVEIGFRNGMLTVIAPLKDTPADRAGIRSGDIIVEVDDQSTQGMTMDEVVGVIRGDIGTEVVFTFAREGEGEFLTISVVRDVIEIPTMEYEVVEGDVFIISLYNFGGTATREMRNALREFVAGSYTRLIIDLRGNPGGYLSAAVDVASWFLPAGKVIVTEDYGDNKESIVHRSKGQDVTKDDWRIAILVDGGSASASEIVAGALREHGKAVLIGEQTFGKGSVQELVPVTPDTSLKVTVARWLTPESHSISASGLEPDLVVPLTNEDIEQERDPQREAAIMYVRTGVLESPPIRTSSTDMELPLEGSGNLE